MVFRRRKKVEVRKRKEKSLEEVKKEIKNLKDELFLLYAKLALNKADLFYLERELKKGKNEWLLVNKRAAIENINELKENIEEVKKMIKELEEKAVMKVFEGHPDLQALNMKYIKALEVAEKMLEEGKSKEEIKKAVLKVMRGEKERKT